MHAEEVERGGGGELRAGIWGGKASCGSREHNTLMLKASKPLNFKTLPVVQTTYLFKARYIQTLIRNPKKGRSLRLQVKPAALSVKRPMPSILKAEKPNGYG